MSHQLESPALQHIPWLLTQDWHDLLFMHFPVSKHELFSYIPEGLELDTYEGQAWITIIPFKVRRMRARKTPPVPLLHEFLEINVRTYVKRNHLKGIYFFSLDASSLPVVLGGRIARLPYILADMSMHQSKNKVTVHSNRKGAPASLKVHYEFHGKSFDPAKNSLHAWLLERYYLWSYRKEKLYEGAIHHEPWEIYEVDVQFEMNDMLPLNKVGSPLFSYASFKSVRMWPTIKVE